MNRKEQQKGKRERRMAAEFLRALGLDYRVHGVRGVPKGSTGPDVRVTCLVNGDPVRLGIEVTEYQTDRHAPVTAREINAFFWQFDQRLRRLRERDPRLLELGGQVFFDRTRHPIPRDAQCLALQTRDFLRSHLRRFQEEEACACFSRWTPEGTPGDFETYPLLKRHFRRLHVRRCPGLHRLDWSCDGSAFVYLNRNVVREMIARKGNALCAYNTDRLREMWLVICASTTTSAHDTPGPLDWVKDDLSSCRDSARETAFDRVYFWDRRCDYWVELKSQECGQN